MITYKHLLWSTPTLLIVAVMVAVVGAGVPTPTIAAQAAATPKVDQKVKIRKEEEQRLKKQDKSYIQQVKTLSDQYAATAKLVASRGGDNRALLDAAAYFQNEAK
jgi:alanine dehydrogenase